MRIINNVIKIENPIDSKVLIAVTYQPNKLNETEKIEGTRMFIS